MNYKIKSRGVVKIKEIKCGDFFTMHKNSESNVYLRGEMLGGGRINTTRMCDGSVIDRDDDVEVYPVRIVSEPVEFEFV